MHARGVVGAEGIHAHQAAVVQRLHGLDGEPVVVQHLVHVFHVAVALGTHLGAELAEVERVRLRMSPVEGTPVARVVGHQRGIHVVVLAQHLLAQERDQAVARRGHRGVAQHAIEGRVHRIVLHEPLLQAQHLGVRRILARHPPPNVDQEVAIQSERETAIEGRQLVGEATLQLLHVGIARLQLLDGVGRIGDQAQPLLAIGLIGRRLTQQELPLLRELALVVQVGVIRHAVDLVREPERQFLVQAQVVGVVAKAAVAHQIDARVHPRPALLGRVGEHADVVGHVVAMEAPHLGEARLQLGDQIRVGHGLVEQPLLLA